MAWVFQGNPEYYDIDRYFTRQDFVYWNCPKFADQMQLGMPVLFKRSGPENGIIALGEIAEVPKLISQIDRPEFSGSDLWTSEPDETIPKVGIQLSDVRLTIERGMLPWSELKRIESLANHPLIKAGLGTVFRLSATQALDLLRTWGSDDSVFLGSAPAAREGNRREVKHFRIERDQGLVRDKKSQFLQAHGYLKCEVCGFRYDERYPADLAEGFIEAHHIRPLAELDTATRTTLEDLILVCANCHRMIHRTKEVERNLERLREHFREVV